MVASVSEQWLLDEIDSYVLDEKRQYAIAIEGPWGSGKTRFLNDVLAPSLKGKGKRMVRVSLFGMRDADQLYEKLGALLVRLDGEGRSKPLKFVRGVVRSLVEFANSTLSARVSLQLSMGMKFVVDMLVSNKHVIVFDDVERRSKEADDLSLFGAVSELVEGRGLKVIFVSAGMGGGAQQGREFDVDIREKLIWRLYSYKQAEDGLVRDIFGELAPSVGGIDILECVLEAVKRAKCTSARAMLRVQQMVDEVLRSNILADETIFVGNRKSAFIDVIQFALMVCEGRPPQDPALHSDGEKLNIFNVEYSAASREYEKYVDVPCVDEYFRPRVSGERLDLGSGIRRYIEKRYPNSEDTQAVYEIASSIESDIGSMSDREMVPLVSRLSDVIRRCVFSPAALRDAVYYNSKLSDLGFEEALPEDELSRCCRRAMERDVQGAHEFSRRYHSTFSFGEPADSILAELSNYGREVYGRYLANSVEQCFSQNDADAAIGYLLSNVVSDDARCLLFVDPFHIAWALYHSRPEGQQELRKAVHKLRSYMAGPVGAKWELTDWLSALRGALRADDDIDRMSRLRRRWLLQDIDEYLERSLEEG